MKPRVKKFVLVGVGVAGFAVAGVLVYRQLVLEGYIKLNRYDRREFGRLRPGDAAPDFTLRSPDGGRVFQLSQLVGEKPVVLVFASCT
ncbi:MAG: hypothetical protein ACR2L2_15010 [Acidobacteriota bacterium]